MVKIKGNFEKAQNELKNDKNNAVAFIYEKNTCTNENGTLANAIFTIKDVFATKDAPTQASSLSLENFQPKYDATVLEKFYQAGAIAVGKVHCDELALGGEGIYSHWGIIKNPLDPERKVAGSSSGSAATLTNNISFALGSDTGDSVRLPASFIGKVGFKPSYGAISRYGMFAYSSSLDTVAYFAHNVNDITSISQAAYGVDDKDFTTKKVEIHDVKITKPEKVAFLKLANFLSPTVAKEYQNLAQNLKAANVEVFEVTADIDLLKAIKPVYDIISYSEASSNLANINGIAFGNRQEGQDWKDLMTKTRSNGFGFMVQRRLVLGSFFLNLENQKELFLRAQKIRRLINDYLTSLHQKFDLLIFPAAPDVAPKFNDPANNYDFMNYILTGANLVGNPSITIPWIKDQSQNNLPININLDTKLYNDEKLLSNALWLEKFLGAKND